MVALWSALARIGVSRLVAAPLAGPRVPMSWVTSWALSVKGASA